MYFTLVDYDFTPIFLNAKAITQCRICLSQHCPFMFLYLAPSCVKQIRSVFQLTDDQFSENSSSKCVNYMFTSFI